MKGSNIDNQTFPRVNIKLDKIGHNVENVLGYYRDKEISVTPVTKCVCGSVEIAKLLARYDIHSIGDSRLQNISKMKQAGVGKKFMLIRSPMLSETEQTAAIVDISLNTEITVIQSLNDFAGRYNKRHAIILMIELGELREGILPSQIDEYVKKILKMQNIKLAGIGVNLACLSGIKPTEENMGELCSIARQIEEKHGIQLELVSGGNSSNYLWSRDIKDAGMINHMRIGESILLGTEPISKSRIPGLFGDCFMLQAEIIECKEKPFMPRGEITFNAFGEVPVFEDQGLMNRAIAAIGRQDVDPDGIIPADEGIQIIGMTSDHLILNAGKRKLKVGDILEFRLDYKALLCLMTSPYVEKNYLD